MLHGFQKRGNTFLHGLSVFMIIAIAMGLRLALIALGWPGTNSDESTWGLEAMHIAFRGEWPIFMYGQNYMGTIEAYLAAIMFHFLGTSLFSLRLSMIFLFGLFLLALYFLARLLFSKSVAFITITLLSFGSNELFTRDLKVLGGDMETMLFGALLFLLATHLALNWRADLQPLERRKRFVTYGCLGLVMGLGIWSHMLIMPFVVMVIVLLYFFCRSELRTPNAIWFAVGLIIGALPLLICNVQNPAQNSLVTLWQTHSTGGTSFAIPFTLWDAIRGTFLVSLPQATGAFPLCSLSTTPGVWRSQISSCMLFQGAWGIGFVLLWAIAVFLTLKELRGWRQTLDLTGTLEERRLMIRCAARLCLLGVVGLTLLAYIASPAPALVPITSARYLVGLIVVFPALIAPLCPWLSMVPRKLTSLPPVTGILRVSILLLAFTMFINGTCNIFYQQIPAVKLADQQRQMLIHDLLRIHAVHIYSEYWTCNNLIFQSNERIICSVLADDLQAGQNRYPLYQTIVQNDRNASYVFPVGSPQDQAFQQFMAMTNTYYRYFTFDGYNVYQLVDNHRIKAR